MKLSKELLAVADLHTESSKFSEPVKEGLGKQIARVVTGTTAGARAKQEKEKSFNALRAGDTKAAEKHMQRHLSFEKLLGNGLNHKAIRALSDEELRKMAKEMPKSMFAYPEYVTLNIALKDEIVRRKSLKEDEQNGHVMLPEAVEQLNQLLAEGKISGFKPPFKYDVKSGVLNSVIDSVGKNVCDTKSRQAAKDIADALNMFTKSAVSEAAVAYTLSADDKRLEKLIKAAMNKGDDYTAKSYAKMAETSDGRKYLNSVIKQMMKPLKESAENKKADELEVGDRVVITGKVMHQGDEGEIVEFGKDKKFVTVKLDNDNKTRSFHSTDVTDLKAKYEDDDEEEDDDFEDQPDEDVFYVAVVSMDDSDGGDGFVGKVAIIDGKWRELPAVGKPHYKWGQKYMGYLSQSDIMQYIKKDFGRYYDVKGPFNTLADAKDEAEDSGLELKESQDLVTSFMNRAFDESNDLVEGWTKIHPDSQERENKEREGRRVKTPDGEGVVTRERKVPTFSQMVPFVHEITVKLDSGKSTTYRAKMVKFLKDAKVNEAITYTDIEDWKKAVKNSYPQHASKIRFNGRMEGGKMTVSAEVPGEDRCFGVWDQEDEKGEVLSENIFEADEPSEDEKENEKIIAKADEYRVRLYKDTETVDLLDGEGTTLVTMPLVIWKQLTRQ